MRKRKMSLQNELLATIPALIIFIGFIVMEVRTE